MSMGLWLGQHHLNLSLFLLNKYVDILKVIVTGNCLVII